MKKNITILLVMVLTLGMSATTVFAATIDANINPAKLGQVTITYPDEMINHDYSDGKPATFVISVRTTAQYTFTYGGEITFPDINSNGYSVTYSNGNAIRLYAGVNTYSKNVTITAASGKSKDTGLKYSLDVDDNITSGSYAILKGTSSDSNDNNDNGTPGAADDKTSGNKTSKDKKSEKKSTAPVKSTKKDSASKESAANSPKTADNEMNTSFVFMNLMIMLAAAALVAVAVRLKRE